MLNQELCQNVAKILGYACLLDEFGVGFEDHPLEEVIPALVRRILGEQ